MLLYYIAHRAGVFKQRHVQKFKADLSELEQLQVMVAIPAPWRGQHAPVRKPHDFTKGGHMKRMSAYFEGNKW